MSEVLKEIENWLSKEQDALKNSPEEPMNKSLSKFHYNATNYQKLAEALKNKLFMPESFRRLNAAEVRSVACYAHNFFTFLFGGKGGSSFERYIKDSTQCEKWFTYRPASLDDVIRIVIQPDSNDEMQASGKYSVNVAVSEVEDNIEMHVETKSGKELLTRETLTHSKFSDREDIQKIMERIIYVIRESKAPKWVKEIISSNIPDFSKMDEKSALIFSREITFKSGVGGLLSKLAKAGIKLAVIAEAPEERQRIDALNCEELAGVENKIVYDESVSKVVAKIKGTARFYYFTLDKDGEEDLPEIVIKVDKLTVERIIAAIGDACRLVDGDMKALHAIAENFRVSV